MGSIFDELRVVWNDLLIVVLIVIATTQRADSEKKIVGLLQLSCKIDKV